MKNFLTFLYLFPNFSFLPDNYDNWYLILSFLPLTKHACFSG